MTAQNCRSVLTSAAEGLYRDDPARIARLEYRRLLACSGLKKATGHQMEDGDVCKLCGSEGELIRARANFEEAKRIEEKELLERASAAGPTPEDDDLEPA